jgi:hypothetical protein
VQAMFTALNIAYEEPERRSLFHFYLSALTFTLVGIFGGLVMLGKRGAFVADHVAGGPQGDRRPSSPVTRRSHGSKIWRDVTAGPTRSGKGLRS